MSTATWSTIALYTSAVLVGGSLGAILPFPYSMLFSFLSGVVLFLFWPWKTKNEWTP